MLCGVRYTRFGTVEIVNVGVDARIDEEIELLHGRALTASEYRCVKPMLKARQAMCLVVHIRHGNTIQLCPGVRQREAWCHGQLRSHTVRDDSRVR